MASGSTRWWVIKFTARTSGLPKRRKKGKTWWLPGLWKNKENKKTQKKMLSWSLPTFMRAQPTWHGALIYYVHDLSSQGVEGELPSIKDVTVISINCGTTLHFKVHIFNVPPQIFFSFLTKGCQGFLRTVIFFSGPLLASQRDVGMPRFLMVSECVSISSGQCFWPASENLFGSSIK